MSNAHLGARTLGEVRGVQLSGISNLTTHDFAGLQLSLVNVATGRVRGAQVGLVNYANELSGVSLGLVPYARNGRVQLLAWAGTAQLSNIGVRFTNGPVYTLIHFGHHPEGAEHRVTGGGYLGAHIALKRLFVDVDAGYDSDTRLGENVSEHSNVLRYRSALGYQLARQFGVFAGVGLWQRLATAGVPADYRPDLFAGVQLL